MFIHKVMLEHRRHTFLMKLMLVDYRRQRSVNVDFDCV